MELSAELALRICSDMPAGMLFLDSTYKIVLVNHYFCTRVDFDEGELKTLKFTDLLADSSKFNTMMKKLQDGTINSFDLIVELKKSGHTNQFKRTVFGMLCVQRHPPIGDFHNAIVYFKPFEGLTESWTSKLESLLELSKKYSRLILLLVSTIIGLLTGASKLTWDLSALEQEIKKLETQSSSDSGQSSSSVPDGSPVRPQDGTSKQD